MVSMRRDHQHVPRTKAVHRPPNRILAYLTKPPLPLTFFWRNSPVPVPTGSAGQQRRGPVFCQAKASGAKWACNAARASRTRAGSAWRPGVRAEMRRLPQSADRDAAFAPELLAAIHDVCHGLVASRQPARSSEASPGSGQEEIRDASLRLPERQREVLALGGLAQLSYEEIASDLGVPIGTVRSRIHRGRAALRTALQPRGSEA